MGLRVSPFWKMCWWSRSARSTNVSLFKPKASRGELLGGVESISMDRLDRIHAWKCCSSSEESWHICQNMSNSTLIDLYHWIMDVVSPRWKREAQTCVFSKKSLFRKAAVMVQKCCVPSQRECVRKSIEWWPVAPWRIGFSWIIGPVRRSMFVKNWIWESVRRSCDVKRDVCKTCLVLIVNRWSQLRFVSVSPHWTSLSNIRRWRSPINGTWKDWSFIRGRQRPSAHQKPTSGH